jgi:hypothetical protein
VQDASIGTDIVFNYGTFNFTPDFYKEFILGRLLYSLSVEPYTDFMEQYRYESRSVVEQVVNLECPEKQKLLNDLFVNAREENRYYRYDFLFDNCTTRAGDMIAHASKDSVRFQNILEGRRPTFRNLIHEKLNSGGQYWSKLGIDLLLGAKLDRRVSNREAMFLPDYLLKGFDSATIRKHKLVMPPQAVLNMPSPLDTRSWARPAVIFTLLLVAVAGLSLLKKEWARKVLVVWDFLFFLVLGLSGLLLVFMWFGTNHAVCANNYNLLWALPTHAAAAFFTGSHKPWVKNYFKGTFILSVLLLIAWAFLPQELNTALLPLVALILFRSYLIFKNKDHGRKKDKLPA